MDREALIARREAAGLWAKRWLQGVPTALELDAFYDGWNARGAPTASDAKLLAELKARCDREDEAVLKRWLCVAYPRLNQRNLRHLRLERYQRFTHRNYKEIHEATSDPRATRLRRLFERHAPMPNVTQPPIENPAATACHVTHDAINYTHSRTDSPRPHRRPRRLLGSERRRH